LGGEVPQHIMEGKIDEAEKTILWFKEYLEDDD
jgi:DNA polymerase-3 subunit alpha